MRPRSLVFLVILCLVAPASVMADAGPQIPPLRLRPVAAGKAELPPLRLRTPEADEASPQAVKPAVPAQPAQVARAATPAQPAAPAEAAPPAQAPASGEASAQAGPKDSLDFDLLNTAPRSPAVAAADQRRQEEVARKVKWRRNLLLAHQALGFTTLGVMAATLVFGQLSYLDNYSNGDFSGQYDRPHLGLSIATSALFTATGVLALFAPNPYPKPYRLDSAMLHRVAMALATAGMITQVVLGPLIVNHAGKLDQGDLALAHLITGYATFGFMATGVLSYVF